MSGIAAVVVIAGACRRVEAPAPVQDEDPRPYTPWHARDDASPFPSGEWYWQELLATAPAPEPLPADAAAATELKDAFGRLAERGPLDAEEELDAMVELARRDLGALLQALDDPNREARFAAARIVLRLVVSEKPVAPQRLVEAAAHHLRDSIDEVALLHLETLARSGYAWTTPLLLRTFGLVDNHRLVVLRIRAAAKLVKRRNYAGIPLLIRALKEQTSIQDDVHREWDVSPQTAWWKEEAMVGIAAAAGTNFGHSPDASDAEQVAVVRKIEGWWNEHAVELWSHSPPIEDPALVAQIRLVILGLGTFQLRNVDNASFILQGLGPPAAPLLFEALRGSSFMVRRHLLGILANLIRWIPTGERQEWLRRVEGGLADPDPAIRVRSLEVIGASRLPSVVERLKKVIRGGDAALAETALRLLSEQPYAEARAVLMEFSASLAADALLRIPALAARLAAGDLAPLDEYLALLSSESGPNPRAQMYLSWILESDGLADAHTKEERTAALARLRDRIREHADLASGKPASPR